jgi:hypothetical protein
MTLAWLLIWFIANNVGGSEPLLADPVNGWTATLILAVAVDLSRPDSFSARGQG